MEPPNNGHTGTSHFVIYREVVLSLEVEMYCTSMIDNGPPVSFTSGEIISLK